MRLQLSTKDRVIWENSLVIKLTLLLLFASFEVEVAVLLLFFVPTLWRMAGALFFLRNSPAALSPRVPPVHELVLRRLVLANSASVSSHGPCSIPREDTMDSYRCQLGREIQTRRSNTLGAP